MIKKKNENKNLNQIKCKEIIQTTRNYENNPCTRTPFSYENASGKQQKQGRKR